MDWRGKGRDGRIKVGISNQRVFGSSGWEHDVELTNRI